MCGIVGAITRKPIERGLWTSACRIQAHRGPDGDGEWSDAIRHWHVHLAHQRLAILDLSPAGAQPMVHPETGSVLILNGEIYNYIEIRAELEAAGAVFTGHSDTEVLLHALELWGIADTLPRLNGMWAFAWVDAPNRRLYLSRDRCGEKPLYILSSGESLYFASELKTVLTLQGRTCKLNLKAIGAFLTLGLLDVTEESLIDGITQVGPGTYTEISLDMPEIECATRTFWACPCSPSPSLPWREYIDQLGSLFIDSVRMRLRSDVPVGILLSGGLDSSSIAASAKVLGANKMQLLSAVTADPRFDESPFIDIMAQHLGWPVIKVLLPNTPSELFEHIDEATWHMDGPVGSLSNILHYLLMKAAKEAGISVILGGQGGDEMLCGYRKYLGFHIQSLLREGHLLGAARTIGSFMLNSTVINQFHWGDAKRYLPKIFQGSVQNILGERLTGYRPEAVGLQPGHTLSKRQELDVKHLSIPSINHSEDRMSMAWAREIRLPFLDHRIIELLIPAPAEYKLAKGWTKYAMRCALEPLLPPPIVWRKDKQGFSNPESEWLKEEIRSYVHERYLTEDSLIFRMGLVNRSAYLAHYERYRRQPAMGGNIYYGEIFGPIALEVWLRRFSPFIEGAA